MNAFFPSLIVVSCFTLVTSAAATTRYVDVNNPLPALPYDGWASAATNLQDAVDAASPGDEILVTNGVYAAGGRMMSGSLTLSNRVVVDKAVTLRSVNGPQVTVIQGRAGASGAFRCATLVNGAVLSGFTLTNGATASTGDLGLDQSGGALYCESVAAVVTNCVIVGNHATRYGGGAYRGTLQDCTVVGNDAMYGGGAYGTTLLRCAVLTNTATTGAGGGYSCPTSDSTLAGNVSPNGGGAQYATLTRCTLAGNAATTSGGGASASTLNHCTVVGNTAATAGGGANGCNLNNCLLTGNSVTGQGGAGAASQFDSCTAVGNTAGIEGGGVALSSTVNKSIVYFNTAPAGPNCDSSTTINATCTTPLPPGGFGNLAADPRFVSVAGRNFRLQSDSPCINSGPNGAVAFATDLDGNPRVAGGTVDLGAYEFQSPSSTLAYGWAQQYGLPTDGSADGADPDADGASNWHESHADTNPTNALSVLRLTGVTRSPAGAAVTWRSEPTRSYYLERSTNLGLAAFQLISNTIPGAAGTITVADPAATNFGPYFYRVGVR
jgi:hypothetical protein